MIRYTSILFLMTLISIANICHSSSTIIEDNRISHLGSTPVPGKGYSFINNQVKSMCFEELNYLGSSIDLKYEFLDITKDMLSNIENSVDPEKILTADFLKKNVSFIDSSVKNDELKKFKLHNILITAKMIARDEAIDEINSSPSKKLINALKNGKLDMFFSKCGGHYIRSVGRYAVFMFLFQYRMIKEPHDTNFQLLLKQKLSAFHDLGLDKDFEKELKIRKTKIFFNAVGVPVNEFINPFPADINEYKISVQKILKSFQSNSAGIITSMEISSWADSLYFQKYLHPSTYEEMEKIEKRKNLEANSGVISEINRIDNTLMDLYYRTSNCYRILRDDYPIGDDEYSYDPNKTYFYDLANPLNNQLYKTLKELLKYINLKLVNYISKINDNFLFGNENNQGANDCREELKKYNLIHTHYSKIKSCNSVMSYKTLKLPIIEHFCMPQIVERRN